MPIFDFECTSCGSRFEELKSAEAVAPPCPSCGAKKSRRLFSPPSPPGHGPSPAEKRDSDLRRGEREAARRERISEVQKASRSS
jgi:putative FmdB family regulatory protein